MNVVNEVIDEFVDFEGKTHKFVIVAVKTNLKDGDYPMVMYIDGDTAEGDISVRTGLKIGISICNPVDRFDERVGIKAALARAENADCVLYSEHPGQLGNDVINAYLKQEAEYVKNNPAKFIRGYKEKQKRFETQIEMDALKSTFSEFENEVFEKLKEDPTCLETVFDYLEYSNKCESASMS